MRERTLLQDLGQHLSHSLQGKLVKSGAPNSCPSACEVWGTKQLPASDSWGICSCCRPVYTPAANQLTFQYVVLPANSTLPASGGTVNSYASETTGAEANAATTLPYVTPGSTTFFNAR